MRFFEGCAYALLIGFVLLSIVCAIICVRMAISPVPVVPTCNNVAMHPADMCNITDTITYNYDDTLKYDQLLHYGTLVVSAMGAFLFGLIGIVGLVKSRS